VTAVEPDGDAATYGPPFSAYQAEIFLRGLSGETPAQPVALAALADAMRTSGDPEAVAYVFGGAGAEDTMRANEAAFRRWRIVPRMLRDVSARDLSATVLGTPLPAPLALAPIGLQSIVHPDGELAVARAAAAVGMPMAVSTMTSETLEAIAHTGSGPKWFQLYWPTDRELMQSFLARADGAGSRAGSGSPTTCQTRSSARGWPRRLRTTRSRPCTSSSGSSPTRG
jgi:lactate 2-monooxygenase